MSTGIPNELLASLLAESGLSRKAFARAVHTELANARISASVDHTSVSRWLNGVRPAPATSRAIASVLSARLGRQITPDDLGLHASTALPLDFGLAYSNDALVSPA